MAKKKVVAGGLSVPEAAMTPLSAVNMSPYNPRVMPAGMMRALKASLAKHGMVLNLVCQRRSAVHGEMVLIGGHQRVRAMRELCAERGWEEPVAVPVVVLDVSDSVAKQLNVSLNNVEGDFDPHKLGLLFADVYPDMTQEDVYASGFEPDNIQELIKLTVPPDEAAAALEDDAGALEAFAASITLSIEFETVARRDEAKELLRALAKESGVKAGDLVLDRVKAAAAARGKKKRAA